MSEFTLTATCAAPFDKAVEDVRSALADKGFGIITEIDMKATLKEKLGVDTPDQVILGACNPRFAHQAIQADPKVAALLPCNVVVRSVDASTTVVDAFDPATMERLASTTSDELEAVAAEVRGLLTEALATVDDGAGTSPEEE